MLPPLGMLRAFEAAARLASFSRAADELHVTHAAVSHQIRLLEEWFGRPLFRREKRGVGLLPDAERLADALTSCFARIAIETEMLRANAKSSITVACIPSIATRWLIPALSDFLERHPDVDVKVIYAMAEQRLRETGCDVLITLGADLSVGTQCDRLCEPPGRQPSLHRAQRRALHTRGNHHRRPASRRDDRAVARMVCDSRPAHGSTAAPRSGFPGFQPAGDGRDRRPWRGALPGRSLSPRDRARRSHRPLADRHT